MFMAIQKWQFAMKNKNGDLNMIIIPMEKIVNLSLYGKDSKSIFIYILNFFSY